MTPPAPTSTPHRPGVRRKAAPASPRRVSGPAGGRRAAAGSASAPRSGPARHRAADRRRRLPFPARLAAWIRALPDHALLDRVVRGRAWIPLLGMMLAGIVAMQVEVLKLGASMGRAIERGTALQSRNELLRASVASLSDDQRIERLAAGMGMVMPAPTAVAFLTAQPGAAQSAVSNIHQPDGSAFLSSLAPLTGSSTGGSTTATSTGQAPTTTTPQTVAPAQSPAATPTAAPAQAPADGQPSDATGG